MLIAAFRRGPAVTSEDTSPAQTLQRLPVTVRGGGGGLTGTTKVGSSCSRVSAEGAEGAGRAARCCRRDRRDCTANTETAVSAPRSNSQIRQQTSGGE